MTPRLQNCVRARFDINLFIWILFYTNQNQTKLVDKCVKQDQTTSGGTDRHIHRQTDRQTDIPISHTRALAHLKNTWFCATMTMQKHGLMNTLRASFYESSQRGLRARRVSERPLRALRDSQTLGEFESSLRARGPASGNDDDDDDSDEVKPVE